MATTLTEIYEDVGEIIIGSMIDTLKKGRFPLDANSPLIKSIDFDVNFQQKDIKSGRFKTLTLSLFMNEYGLALDKGRQGQKKNTNIATKWTKAPFTGVPVEELIKWIRRKGLQQKIKGVGGRFISLNSIAFIINRSIKMNGITPGNFIIPALEKGEAEMSIQLDNSILDILTEPLVEVYKQN